MANHYVANRKALEQFLATVDIPNGWGSKTKTRVYIHDTQSNHGYVQLNAYEEPSDGYHDLITNGLSSDSSEAVAVSWGWATAIDDHTVRRRVMVIVHADRKGWTLGTVFEDAQDEPVHVEEEAAGLLSEFIDTLYEHIMPVVRMVETTTLDEE